MNATTNQPLFRMFTGLLIILGLASMILALFGFPLSEDSRLHIQHYLLIAAGLFMFILGLRRQLTIWKKESSGEWEPPADSTYTVPINTYTLGSNLVKLLFLLFSPLKAFTNRKTRSQGGAAASDQDTTDPTPQEDE